MRQSVLFTKTRKEIPKDEVSTSAQLLLRAGFVQKELAGVYSFLPLGWRVLNRVVEVIRQEMVGLGAIELHLSALQDPSVWIASDRWDDHKYDIWFKSKLKNDAEVGLATTHEEPLTRIMKEHVSSYRDLPQYVFQFQTKFRNELRAKSGLLRTREFLMKDLYSFTKNKEELEVFYEKVAEAYGRIWKELGIEKSVFRTFASGGTFTKFSDEFQALCDAGEDTVYISSDKKTSINEEVFTDEVLVELGKKKSDFEKATAIEVGNIFKLGTKYSEALGLMFTGEDGKQQPVVMGSYGIGPARAMAATVELLADEKGLVWPKSITPFDAHVIELNPKHNSTIAKPASAAVLELEKKGVTVLHDDREMSAGEKFADSDLIGIPTRIIVSDKTVQAKKFEVKDRASGKIEHLALVGLIKRFK